MTAVRKNISNFFVLIVIIVSISFTSSSEECRLNNFNESTKKIKLDTWNTFLKDLFTKFSEHRILKSARNNENYVPNFIGGINVTSETAPDFINNIINQFQDDLSFKQNAEKVSNIIHLLPQAELDKLEFILDNTLRERVSIECKGTDIVISGNFIFLSDLAVQGNLLEKCSIDELNPDILLKGVKQSVKIYAFNTIFIDSDINEDHFDPLQEAFNYDYRRGYPIVIIAPTWKVIDGKHEIASRAISVDKLLKTEIIKEEISNITLDNKRDGLPGLPGAPGHDFFGIGDKFIDGKKLTIISIGGKGGNGKNGQNGYDGWSEYGFVPDCKIRDCLIKDYGPNKFNGTLCGNNSAVIEGAWKQNGGDGGAKGVGGKPGSIVLIELGKSSNIQKIFEKGHNGEPGKAGFAGIYHYNSSNLLIDKLFNIKDSSARKEIKYLDYWSPMQKAIFTVYDYGLYPDKNISYKISKEIVTCDPIKVDINQEKRQKYDEDYEPEQTKLNEKEIDYHYVPGVNGIDGKTKFPSDVMFSYQNQTKVINGNTIKEYQHYFRKKYNFNMRDFFQTKFIEKLNGDVKIADLTTASDLVNELYELENESYQSKDKDTDLIPFYELLLNKIDLYIRHRKCFTKCPDFYLLQRLYAATLSRVNGMRENLNPYLITNVPSYFKTLRRNFKSLKKMCDRNKMENVKKTMLSNMQRDKDSFKNNIEGGIQEANKIIKTGVGRELSSINRGLRLEMKNLMDEINVQKEESEKNKKTLQEEKDSLLWPIIGECVSQITKSVAVALQFAGPVGTLASIPVALTGGVIGVFSTNAQNEAQHRIGVIQKDVQGKLQSLTKQMDFLKGSKAINLKNILYELKNVTVDQKFVNMSLEELNQEIDEKLDAIDNANYEQLVAIENDMNSKFKEFREQFEKLGESAPTEEIKQNYKIYGDMLNKAAMFCEIVPSTLLSAYFAYSKLKDQQEKVEYLISLCDRETQSLKLFEDSIYPEILEKLNEMMQNLAEIQKKVGVESKVSLEFLKTKADLVFARTKTVLEPLVTGRKMMEELFLLINNLERLLPFLINTNNVIQDFHEQQRLADLITSMGMNVAEISGSGNAVKESTVLELDTKIYSNILIKQYKLAYLALEQYLFPYSSVYLLDLDFLNEPLESSVDRNNVTELIEEVYSRIGDTVDQIDRFNVMISRENTNSHNRTFNSEDDTTPFHIWKNVHNLLINNTEHLFSDGALLNADILTSSWKSFDALKFNKIGLYFKAAERQEELDKIMESFNINLVHLGDNHYRLHDKIYLIKTSNVTIKYSFKKKHDSNDPVDTNSGYSQLMSGSYLLSPYALWKVKLENNEDGDAKNKEKLKAFAETTAIDLELRGEGKYVERETSIPDYNYKFIKQVGYCSSGKNSSHLNSVE